MKILKQLINFSLLILSLWSCNSDFLEAKPQKSLMIPRTLGDLEAILNNSNAIMNRAGYLSLAADGDFRISESYLLVLNDPIRFNYKWSDETTAWIGDWDYAYQQIFYVNVVLEGLKELKVVDNREKAEELRGRALFYRAWALHLTAEQFAGIYEKETAGYTVGIPCPISPDVNQKVTRLTLEETYHRMFTDLQEAIPLLPDFAAYVTQPSKASAHALLARLYLITGDYDNAFNSAETSLDISGELMDYSKINFNLARPFPIAAVNRNPEVLFHSFGLTSFTANNSVFVDSSLLSLYKEGDLRRKLYFTSFGNYKGSYTGGNNPFVGLATDEVYLIKAECYARAGDIINSRNTLKHFLVKRYSKDEQPEIGGMSSSELLKFILLERRRELVGRGVAWMDLRRLNRVSEFQRTLERTIEGRTYVLEPGDKRYTMKIPLDEITSSGINQNP